MNINMIKNISSQNLIELLETDPASVELIDVREENEYAEGHIKDSKIIPFNSVKNRLDDIDWSKKVVFYCRTGGRSFNIGKIIGLEKEVYNLDGGIIDFAKHGGNQFFGE